MKYTLTLRFKQTAQPLLRRSFSPELLLLFPTREDFIFDHGYKSKIVSAIMGLDAGTSLDR
jgi:hypothetical protein